MKLIFHLLVFFAGAGVGVWWGVNHPAAAQNVSDQEVQQAAKVQAAVSQEKIALLQKFLGNNSADQNVADFKQMLSDEKQKLQNATAKLGN
jgi:uncharacterized membrane protein